MIWAGCFSGTGLALFSEMARSPRKYAVPLVVTFVAMTPACSGKIRGPEDDAGGSGSSPTVGDGDGDLGTGGGAGANPPGWGETGGTGGVPGPCDLDQLVWTAECPAQAECFVEVGCTGGTPQKFFMSCQQMEGYAAWAAQALSCEHLTEECSHQVNEGVRFRCVENSWQFWAADGNLNPPGPCPHEKPEEGSGCLAGDGFGSDPTECGYPCESGPGWTTMGCQGGFEEESEWSSDGACAGGIGGSAGGAPE